MYNPTANVTNRATRVAAVQAALLAKHIAAKQAKHIAAAQQAKQQAYLAAVQQLAAQYGVTAPNTLAVRNSTHVQKHAPSAASGACAMVHKLAAQCKYVRAATLAACTAAGINPATASTQFAVAKRNHMVAVAQGKQ